MKIVWLIINTIATSWFSYVALLNPVIGVVIDAMDERGVSTVADRMAVCKRTSLALFGALAALHIALAVSVCLFVSVSKAVIVTSIAAFGATSISYFLNQRFADPIYRSSMAQEAPMVYPFVLLVGFISCNFAIVLFLGWQCVFLPIVLWLLLGFLCAEMSIRRLMRRDSDCDRKHAIYRINKAQGRLRSLRGMYKNKNRYPFP